MLAFCQEVARHEGTTLEYITSGCLDAFSDEEIDLMATMSATAQRPLNWNLLTVDGRAPEKTARQLEASTRASEVGGQIVALTMPTLVPMNMSFLNHCALFLIPGWGEVMGLPVSERMIQLADPAVRRRLDDLAHAKEAGVFRRLAGWGNYVIGDTYSPANEGFQWREVEDIARELGKEPFDTLLDIVIADGLRTVLWPKPTDRDDATWALRAEVWEDPRAMVGGSDAGAHLDRMCGSNYPTSFLGDCLRNRQLATLERAVHMMTEQPARLFGLRERGVIAPGMHADLFVFDPATVASEPARLVNDLPGGMPRLFAASIGVAHVLVNGTETITEGKPTGEVPGTVLRSGRDTYSVIPAN
jgi:N-acyl-D-aspartate/D-glutamate deacylase